LVNKPRVRLRACRCLEQHQHTAFWPAESVQPERRPLDASLDAYDVGTLRMFSITAPAHHVARDTTCGELPTDDFYKLVLQVSGRGIVKQQQRRVELSPGQWILYDPRAPYAITNSERCTLLVTQVLRSLLSGLKLSGPLAGQTGHDNVAGLHGVFGTYLRALSEQLPSLPDARARRSANQ